MKLVGAQRAVTFFTTANIWVATMKIPKPITIDFETKKIEGRPAYPPTPVGVAIKEWGKKAKYYAWAHPTANNSTKAEAKKALKAVWGHKDGLLFQNGKFDVDVAWAAFDLPPPPPSRCHDTMFLLFLDDPHQKELSLKPAAERLLDLPPEEQDAVGEWLIKNQPVPGVKISRSRNSEHYFGAYISEAPGDLVGEYAIGDVVRTELLFKLLYPKTVERNMLEAYDRERQLMPILLEAEREGLPVDLKRLRRDVNDYRAWLERIDDWIKKTISAPTEINLDSGEELLTCILACGKADESKLARTETGKLSFSKESLLHGVSDKTLLAVLKYRTQLLTCLRTFMEPWLKVAEVSGGFIYTNWNQVRQPSGDHSVGTRSGRLSSTPNFQNIPNEFKPIFAHELKGLPRCPIRASSTVLPPLPRVRSYVLPFKGHVLIDRDYSQQEPRLLGHFEGGSLLKQYQANPWLDLHDNARDELAKAGKYYDRKPVKNTNLGLIYGMGVGKLAEKNEMAVDEAKALKKAILKLYPGLEAMYRDMRERARTNKPLRTWGGREYYCEPAKIINGRTVEFDYKMVNTLIQGSAADCTKEAIIRYHKVKHREAKILLNVHDQITVSAPKAIWKQEMKVLQECMESIELDVLLLSEGKVGPNWDDLKDYDKKGVIINAKAA